MFISLSNVWPKMNKTLLIKWILQSSFSFKMRTDFFGRICQSCKRFPDDAGDDNDYDFDDDRGQEIFSFTQKEERGRLQIGRMEKVRMRMR